MAGSALKRRRAAQEDGQALILMVLALVVMLGFVGLVIDIGRAYLASRQLQTAVDAAALVAGQTMPNSTNAQTQAINYSATGFNAHPGMMTTANAPTVKFKCLTTLANNNVPCTKDPAVGANPCLTAEPIKGCNAVQVTQTVNVRTTFARLFIPSFNVTRTATVGMRGGVPHPLDIMVVIDSTASMDGVGSCAVAIKDPNPPGNTVITSGQATKMDCAKDGVRQLIKGLLPCNQSLLTCVGNPAPAPLDRVGIMTFPGLKSPGSTVHFPGVHDNLSLETSYSCSGQFSGTAPGYVGGGGFPQWFLQSSDLTYGQAATPAVPAVAEVDRLTVQGDPANHAPPGTQSWFTLTVGAQGQPTQTTPHINWTHPAPTVLAIQTEITNIVGVGNATVALGPGATALNPVWDVTFDSSLGDVTFTRTDNLSSGSISASEQTKGNVGSPAQPAQPAEYMISPLTNDYKTTNISGFNSASAVVQAISWSSCPGGSTGGVASVNSVGYPGNRFYGINSRGGVNTYYTGALQAAQAELVAAADPARHAQPVIILLSDGDANTGPQPRCTSAVTVAQAAATPSPPLLGTWLYSIIYDGGGVGTGCSGDGQNDAYTAMGKIARNSTTPNTPDATKFFCVRTTSRPTLPCQDGATLQQVFTSIGTSLTASRLYPDDTP